MTNVKGRFTVKTPFRSAWQTVFVGGLAATAAFVLANVFKPEVMTQTTVGNFSLGGPNLAVVSGIVLIFAAVLLSLVYMRLTRLPSGNQTK